MLKNYDSQYAAVRQKICSIGPMCSRVRRKVETDICTRWERTLNTGGKVLKKESDKGKEEGGRGNMK